MRRRRIESFLLRIVVSEEGCLTSDIWHGRLQHIGTGAEYPFADVTELLGLMTQHVQPVGLTAYDIEAEVSEHDGAQ